LEALTRCRQLAPLVLLAFAPALAAQHLIVLDDTMMARLGRLADTAQIEYARCLIGRTFDDSLVIDLAVPPAVEKGTTIAVTFGGCSVATVGHWHNHLPFYFTPLGVKVGPAPTRASCALSEGDRASALQPEAPPLQVIHVSSAVYCLWVKADGQLFPVRFKGDSS
jgi:hypothetical protein